MNKPEFIKEETVYKIDHDKIPAGTLALLTFCKHRKTMENLGFHSNLVNYIDTKYPTYYNNVGRLISIGGVVGCANNPNKLDMIVCTEAGSFTITILVTMISSGEVKLEIVWKYEDDEVVCDVLE